ncbi:nucleotide exchange factor GrpE [Thermostilla marina]
MSKKHKPTEQQAAKAAEEKRTEDEQRSLEPEFASATSDESGNEASMAAEEEATTVAEEVACEASAEAELENLRAQLAEANERAMRWQAELENYRKRVTRQAQEERKYAGMDLFRDLLPIVDNLKRAVDSAEQNHDIEALLSGLKMVLKQIEDTFCKHHCVRIEAEGSPFDPNLHEAISRQPSNDHPPNTVVYVTQEGYTLHDRVVRPSQVIVSFQPEADDTHTSGDEECAEETTEQEP